MGKLKLGVIILENCVTLKKRNTKENHQTNRKRQREEE